MHNHAYEVISGERFSFGKNWSRFLSNLNDDRIELAKVSLQKMLGAQSLEGLRFLDAGSGSGLFSLAARMLGANVYSFDYDPDSVACTAELKRRYFPDTDVWTIEEASVLNRSYLSALGQFDIVYSWGVLHHTGAMWDALENISTLVSPNGQLFIAIYNDQGGWSRRWKLIKKLYNWLPAPLKLIYAVIIMFIRELKYFIFYAMRFRLGGYIKSWTEYSSRSLRGMNKWNDLIDWVGGYPFEVAKPEQVFDFYRSRGFILERLKTAGGGVACNEFVFKKAE